jgi:hypothetical protein
VMTAWTASLPRRQSRHAVTFAQARIPPLE